MKIVQLNAENIKRLVAVEIRPDGNLVEITGKNGQGKTSILDAIWWALDTNKVVQSKPVHEGAESGFVKLDLGEYVVIKKFKVKEDGEVTISLTVQNKDGFKAGSPQELLKSFIGNLTFDPLAFTRMKETDQVVALRGLVPGYDFAADDKANKADFDARTDVNRTIRDLKARIEAIEVSGDESEVHVDASTLMAELQSAMDHNSSLDTEVAKRERHNERVSQLKQQIQEKRQEIKRIEDSISATEDAVRDLEHDADFFDDVGEKIDLEPIRQRVESSEEVNRRVARRKQRSELAGELKSTEEKSAKLTKAIDDRKAAAAKAVRDAKLPVDGLELTEDAVLLNGQPFNQGSDAEQLRVSIAVAGAMNPKLRVIRVRDGSLLDADSMAVLTKYAEDNDLQVWVETVSSGRETAVVIEDGRVAGASA